VTDFDSLFWASFDTVNPVFSHSAVEQWPADQFKLLLKLGLIEQTASATYVVCPECPSGHDEEVITVAAADGRLTFWIRCPEALRVEIPASDLERWTIDFDCAADAISESLSLSGRRSVRIPSRLWRLGRTEHRGSQRDVFLARGLAWLDGEHIASEIRGVGRPIVLIGDSLPHGRVLNLPKLTLAPLSQAATVSEHGLDLDAVAMFELIIEADRAAHTIGGLTLSDRELNSMIRRQIDAHQKSTLTDDAIVAAYKIFGTARATEEALRKEGFEVDHSTIARKVKKAEEANELRSEMDSASVARTVASRSCDRQQKILERQ